VFLKEKWNLKQKTAAYFEMTEGKQTFEPSAGKIKGMDENCWPSGQTVQSQNTRHLPGKHVA
jgi:hypothetical protein